MRGTFIRLLPFLSLLALGACQPDEAKLEEHMARGDAYLEEEQLPEAIIEYKNALQIDPNFADAHYGLAKAYLKDKKTREGFWELRETARLDSTNLEAKLQFGQIAVFAGELEESLKQAEDVIAANPEKVGAYLLKGRALEALRRAQDAGEAYEKALEVNPESEAALLMLAIHRRRQGDREGAEPLYRKLTEVQPTAGSFTAYGGFLAEDPSRDVETEAAFVKAIELAEPEQRVRAISMLAGFYFNRDRVDEAIRGLEKGIESEDDPLDLIYLLARLQRSLGNKEQADRLIAQAAEARPDKARTHLILSAYLGRQGDLKGALEAADKAMNVEPENTLAKLRKAEVLIEIGYRDKNPQQIAEGSSIVDAILAAEPSRPGALFVKAKVDLSEERIDDAVTSLRAAIDARPDWAQAHFVLGTALALQGEGTMARAELARALELDAGLLEARRALAKVHVQLREPDYAIEEGRRYLRERPDDVETRVLVAQSLILIQKPQEALEELQAIPEESRDAGVQFALGRVQTILGNNEEAHALFLSANESNPENPEILRSLMALDFEMDRAEESEARIGAALEANPDDSQLHRLQGLLFMRQNRGDEAEKSFRKAIALDPRDVRSYEYLARYYTRTGRLQETIQTFEKALEAVPDEARLHHFLGVLYESKGDQERAIQRYESAIQHDSNLAESKNNLAYLLADRNENLDRALDLAQEAKATMPGDPNAADTLGWVLFKRGIPSAAISYLKEAEAGLEASNPSIDVVRYHLALAYEANGEAGAARDASTRALQGLQERKQQRTGEGDSERPEPSWVAEARAILDRVPEPEEAAPGGAETSAPSAGKAEAPSES